LDGPAAGKAWKLQLVGLPAVAAVEHGTTVEDPMGIVIVPARGARVVRVTLADEA
jgi:hypothetical protein